MCFPCLLVALLKERLLLIIYQECSEDCQKNVDTCPELLHFFNWWCTWPYWRHIWNENRVRLGLRLGKPQLCLRKNTNTSYCNAPWSHGHIGLCVQFKSPKTPIMQFTVSHLALLEIIAAHNSNGVKRKQLILPQPDNSLHMNIQHYCHYTHIVLTVM